MKSPLFLCVTLVAANIAFAQPPSPPTTDPSSASSPHQRETTSSPVKETPAPSSDTAAPSSPHQKEVTKSEKMMNDCITKRRSASPTTSKDEAKKACEAELKKKDTR